MNDLDRKTMNSMYPPRPIKALSIRAPWWWFILHGGKDIENRDWPTNFRGTIYVHASKWWRVTEAGLDTEDAINLAGMRDVPELWPADDAMRSLGGHIVGKVDIVDCIAVPQPETVSPWFFGEYGFVLSNPVVFANPTPCKGSLGFFMPSVAVDETPALLIPPRTPSSSPIEMSLPEEFFEGKGE